MEINISVQYNGGLLLTVNGSIKVRGHVPAWRLM